MMCLLDTHVMIPVVAEEPGQYGKSIENALLSGENDLVVSVVSLWEIVIKSRLGKLDLARPPADYPELLTGLGVTLLPLTARHVLASHDPPPATRDPFDRLLLSICSADGLRLLTADRALVGHPLAVAQA